MVKNKIEKHKNLSIDGNNIIINPENYFPANETFIEDAELEFFKNGSIMIIGNARKEEIDWYREIDEDKLDLDLSYKQYKNIFGKIKYKRRSWVTLKERDSIKIKMNEWKIIY